ncbi:MAG: PEGA domain-containing protein [Candidatus Levybacteria bacterium]|nr:PEGA domain-containing protein [Candidatus Levybacteria bacterium]
MKKFLWLFAFLVLTIIIFAGTLFYLNRKTGKGALQVTAVPESKVYLNGKLIGITPLCKCNSSDMLPVGDYNVQIAPNQSGLRPYGEKITINRATLSVIDRNFGDSTLSSGSVITLEPLSDKKALEIMVISFPDKSSVFIDNNLVGITPLILKNVTESDHDLKLTKTGYLDKSIRIRTAMGFRLKSIVTLGINPDISSPSAAPDSRAVTPSPSVSKVVILDTPTGFLRVREESSVGSLEIDRVNPGDIFDLISEEEGWFEIKLKNGKTGWISSQYAEKK